MPSNVTEPTWAADTNFASGPRSGLASKLISPDPDQGFVAGSSLPANVLNEILNRICAWQSDAGRSIYGDGSDGDVTIVGTVTLARDMYYENLTVPNGTILDTNGFRIYVRDHCDNRIGGLIISDGLPGATGTTGAVAGGAARSAHTLGAIPAGGAGGTDNGGAGTAGGAVAAAGLGGVGGTGANGASGGGAGAAGGAVTAPTTAEGTIRTLFDAITGRSVAGNQWRGGSGGGGGGGGAGATANGGGSGGAGGGFLLLCAYRLTNNGTIRARGGAGGDGGLAGNDGGGGGGGGGGVVCTIARGRAGSGTISVAGGAAGANGATAATAGAIGLQVALTA